MSAKEYDVQRTDKALRFRIIRHDDVPHQLRDGCCPLQPTKHGCWRDCRYAIVEFNGEKPVRVVGSDGGEPEDQLLVRDWSWVWVEMNKLAAQIADRDAKLIAFAKTAQEMVDHSCNEDCFAECWAIESLREMAESQNAEKVSPTEQKEKEGK